MGVIQETSETMGTVGVTPAINYVKNFWFQDGAGRSRKDSSSPLSYRNFSVKGSGKMVFESLTGLVEIGKISSLV